ncbi:hypothetical protein CHUAL_012501 [Chamberlinius hualienensis]
MKLIVITVVYLCIVVARGLPGDEPEFGVFEPGFQYKFSFIGHALSGMKDKSQYAGYAQRGIVRFITVLNRYVMVKIDQFQTAHLNELLPTENMLAIPYQFEDIKPSDLPQLFTPFKLNYVSGLIRKIVTNINDSEAIVNIKKAIVTPFQMQFMNINIDKKHNPTWDRTEKPLKFYPFEFSSYDVHEKGIEGECEIRYTMESLPWAGNPLAKTLNQERPFTVEKLESVAETLYQPMGPVGDKFYTNHSQLFTLLGVSRSPLLKNDLLDKTKEFDNLTLSLPLSDTSKSLDDLLKRSPPTLFPLAKEKKTGYLGKCLNNLLDNITRSQTEDIIHVPILAQQCARAAGYLTFHELSQIFDDYVKRPGPDNRVLRRTIIDVIIMSGTPQAFIFLTMGIKNGDIKEYEAPEIFSSLPFYIHNPSPIFLIFLGSVCKDLVNINSQAHKICWLSYGSLVNSECNEKTSISPVFPSEPSCSTFNQRLYLKFIEEQLDKANVTSEYLLYIQTLSYMRLGGVLRIMRPYITGEIQVVEMARAKAIDALTRIADDSVQDEILKLASKVLYNKNESSIIRVAAFFAFTGANPRPYHLQRLATLTFDLDEDNELTSLIVSYINERANETTPCQLNEASRARSALNFKFKAEENVALQTTKKLVDDYFSDDYMLGTRLERLYVANNNSLFLSRAIRLRLERSFAGYTHMPFMITYYGEGIESVMKRIFGAKAGLGKLKLDQIFASSYDEPPKNYFHLFDQLKIDPRVDESLSVYLRYKFLSFHDRLFYVDAQSVLSSIRSGELSFSTDKDIDYQYIFNLGFVQHLLPSSLGVPIFVAVQAPTVLDFKGHFKVTAPSLKDLLETPNTAKVISVEINIRTTIGAIDLFKEKYISVGVTEDTYASLPLNFNMVVDLDKSKITKSAKLASEQMADNTVTLFKRTIEPFTVIYPFEYFEALQDIAKPIIDERQITERTYDFGNTLIGLPMKLTVKSALSKETCGSFMKYVFGDNTPLSLFTIASISPQFEYSDYTLVMDSAAARKTEFKYDFDLDYQYSEIQNAFLEGFDDYRGLLGYFLGWSNTPWTCRKPYEEGPPGSLDSVSRPSRQFKHSSASSKLTLQEIPYIIKNSENVLNMKFTGSVTGNVNRYVNMETSMVRNAVGLYDRLQVITNFKNPPYTTDQNLLVTVNGHLYYPNVPCPGSLALESKFIKPITGHFNMTYNQDKKIFSTDVIFNKSKEQIIKDDHNGSWYLKQCMEDLEMDMDYSSACEESEKYTADLKEAKYMIEYDDYDLPSWFVKATRKLEDGLKALWYEHMEEKYVNITGGEAGQLNLTATFSYDDPVVDFKFIRPQKQLYFNRIYYPHEISTFFRPLNAKYPVDHIIFNELTRGYVPPTCTVMKNTIINFENVTYPLPLTPCKHVITKDCSPDDQFSVLVSQISGSSTKKELEIHILEDSIVIRPKTPTAIGEQTSFEVIINDVDKIIKNGDPMLMVKQSDQNDGGKTLAGLVVLSHQIHVISPVLGFQIAFDGVNVQVMASNLWRGDLCGICSEFDGDKSHTFIGPDRCEYAIPKDFQNSYYVTSPVCPPIPPSLSKTCPKTPFPAVISRKKGYLLSIIN